MKFILGEMAKIAMKIFSSLRERFRKWFPLFLLTILECLFPKCYPSCGGFDYYNDASQERYQPECEWCDVPPDLDLDGRLAVWDGPIPVRPFRQMTALSACQKPRVVPDGEGGFYIVAHAMAECDTEEGFCTPLFAQRVSSDGQRLWGDYGVRLTQDFTPCNSAIENRSSFKIARRNDGGIYVVSPGDYSEPVVYINKLSADGDRYFQYLQPLDDLVEDLVEARSEPLKWLEPARIMATESDHLILSLAATYILTIPYTSYMDNYIATVNHQLETVRNDLFHTGVGLSYFLRTINGSIIYLLGTNDEADYRNLTINYAFLGSEGQMVERGFVTLEDAYWTARLLDYDEISQIAYGADGGQIYRLHVNEDEIRLEAAHERFRWLGSYHDYDFVGDGSGGYTYTWPEDVCQINYFLCCENTCSVNLLLNWKDENNEYLYRYTIEAQDSFTSNLWDPNPKLIRSIDGDIYHIWMIPILNESGSPDDYYFYNFGYTICAQRRSLQNIAVWDEEPGIKIASTRSSDTSTFDSKLDETWWYKAIEDGEGGLIIVFYSYESGILAQRISTDGQLMWDTAP